MTFKEALKAYFLEEKYLPKSKEDIAIDFNIEISDYRLFFKTLRELEREGMIELTKKDKYKVVYGMKKALVGRLQGHANGFAFFISDDDTKNDVFIGSDYLNGAIDGDRVEIALIDRKTKEPRKEGKVVKIIEGTTRDIVGTFHKHKDFGFVVPDDKRISMDLYIDSGKTLGAKNRDKVVAKLTKRAKAGKNPEGVVIEVLGNKDKKGVDILSIAKMHGIPDRFSAKTLKEEEAVPRMVKSEELANRHDFRDILTVTIDGPNAKDFDDAISIQKLGDKQWRLFVHIADVAHYVTRNSSIDDDAYERGNSVYLLDRVIPMLPQVLSNGICSLNPNEDRLAMTIAMDVDANGKVIHYDMYESVINSDYRLIYDEVSDYLENHIDGYSNYELTSSLSVMAELFKVLSDKRHRRGSIEFNFPETIISLNGEGVPINVKKETRRISNRILEEFMLLTNETVGAHFGYLQVPFIYRVHEEPSTEKIDAFRKLIHNLGYSIKGKELHSKDFQLLTEEVVGKKEEPLINMLMLRTMKKARYTSEPNIHFGLASDFYSHFTSPIRRYPDLVIHRVLKDSLKGQKIYKNAAKQIERLEKIAEHCSMTERRAEDCERDVIDLKLCEYMEPFVGQQFKGIISSLTNFGIFVQLDNTIEGLVHFKNMVDDYYRFDEEAYHVIGERNHKILKIGQEVEVSLERVDVDRREIDFSLV